MPRSQRMGSPRLAANRQNVFFAYFYPTVNRYLPYFHDLDVVLV